MTTDKKYTPGPWDVDYSTTAQLPYRFIIRGKQVSDDEAAANARLIAAAPELLEALEELEHIADFWMRMGVNIDHNAMEKARAAIAKALGQ